MAKRTWTVRFRATPKPDGLERLAVAVKGVLEGHGGEQQVLDSSEQDTARAEIRREATE